MAGSNQDTTVTPIPSARLCSPTNSSLKVLFRKKKGTQDYWVSPVDLKVFWCSNSPYCPRGSGAHLCLFPKLLEKPKGFFRTKGSIKISNKLPGGLIYLNQSFLERWGVSFYLKVRGYVITLFSWRNPRFGDKNLKFIITFYGKDFKTRIKGSTSGGGVKLPKKNISLNSVIRYKLAIHSEESSLPYEKPIII